MKKKDPTSLIEIELSVAIIGFGGNTGSNNQYFYAFSHKRIILPRTNMHVTVKFSKHTTKNFRMKDVIFSNGQCMLKVCTDLEYNKNHRSICFKNISTESCTVDVSILCTYQLDACDENILPILDTFNCDPQVINDPDPE